MSNNLIVIREVAVARMILDQGLGAIHTVATAVPDPDLVQGVTAGIHILDHTHDHTRVHEADLLPYLEDRDRHLF